MISPPSCRFCRAPLTETFIDLGATPLANSYPSADDLAASRERAYPLHARVCGACFLVQVDDVVPATEIFSDYAYFSSYSDSWLAHAKAYAGMAAARFALSPAALVVEVASNDGYLLRHFKDLGIRVLGIEPAANVAAHAIALGIETRTEFFGQATAERLAAEGLQADLMAANNVLAHVPDIADFVAGFRCLLKPEGVATFEFPHLLNLIEEVQFDTIYHEHYSYLSLIAAERILASADMRVFDVEELNTHGGSLRLFVCHADGPHAPTRRLADVRAKEQAAGLGALQAYRGFAPRAAEVRTALRAFLAEARRRGQRTVAYGAAAKGNTMLNFCGITHEDILAVADRNTTKQGRFLPGSHVPIVAPDALAALRPDYCLILPWNLAAEISAQMSDLRQGGTRFVTAVPHIKVF